MSHAATAPAPGGDQIGDQPRQYQVSGVPVTVCGDAAPYRALGRRFGPLAAGPIACSALSFRFDRALSLEAAPEPTRAGHWRAVYDAQDGEVVYDSEHDMLRMHFGHRIHVVCDPTGGWTRVSVVEPTLADQWLLSHAVVTLPLIEQLERRDLYNVHAAGLSWNGRGLVLAGGSGSGKSTLALALARAGYAFLGDDMLFLSTAGPGVELHGFPDEADVTDATAALFPELRWLLDRPPPPGWPKRSFRLEDVYGLRPIATCRPAAVVFPHVAHTPTSSIEPIAQDQALLELVPNILLTEQRASQAHLAALARLTAETPCYRMATGRDFDALPARLAELLA
jgi:hypothetical protein